MNKWTRNQTPNTKVEELLVFGYSCKIFKDDEKASYIDQEKHLIPWMGNDSLMIDRYDVRGYLHDLTSFDEKSQYSDEMDEEERLCEKERYLALHSNLTEEELYHEEELKRLRAAVASDGAYHEIGFSYDSIENSSSQAQENSTKEDEEEDEPYQAPEGLNVPKGMTSPSNMKIHAIIEKTANFVCVHGGQMEIIIKMKQSDNPQFAFMNLDNPLQPYYRHLVQEIKSGRYKPLPEKKRKESEEEHNDGHYLHPSLISGSSVPKFTVPSINFLRTGDDSYSLLVKNLKQRIEEDALRNSPTIENVERKTDSPLVTDEDTNSSAKVDIPKSSSQNASSEDTSSSDESDVEFDIPPPDVQPIIDKMAEYVAKNGEDFEIIVKGKNDKRFDFLRKDNRYNEYYIYRRNLARKKFGLLPFSEETSKSSSPVTKVVPTSTLVKAEQTDSNSSANISSSRISEGHSSSNDEDSNTNSLLKGEREKLSLKVALGPISFSLKSKEMETPSLEKAKKASALLDDSDGDEEVKAKNRSNPDVEKKLTKAINNDVTSVIQLKKEPLGTEEKPKKLNSEEMEQKLAEEKLKDKLMSAARERLAQQKKDKQLQLERKQKAALFLQMLQKKKNASEGIEKKEIPSRNGNNGALSDEVAPSGSVIPISSYPPSPTRVHPEPNPSHCSSASESSENEKKANKVVEQSAESSSSAKRQKRSSSERKSSRSHKHSTSKKRRRSKSSSPHHKHKRSLSKSRKEKKLPAAYAMNRRSRSKSPRRYGTHMKSRSPMPYWNRWRQ